MAELKPCPFCGGEARIYFDPEGTKDIAGRHWAYNAVCDRCCATSGTTFLKEKAIEAWNRRAEPQKLFDTVSNIDWREQEGGE